jgi:hypothetical protein
VLAPSPAVGRAGELYVLYLDARGDRLDYEGGHDASGGPPYPGRFALVLARSRDRGATWQESVVDDRIVPARRFVAFLPPFPALAVDRGSGRVYVGFEDARRGSADVSVWALDPGASGWRGPVRVNDTRGDDRTSQYLPRLAVAPGGRLDVVYYDRREDRRRNRRNEVSLQSSTDGARSFGPRLTLSSRDFDASIGAGSERGLPDLGSRLGLVSGREDAVAVWADTRAGTDASHKQDLVRATVSFGDGGRGGGVTALRIAGVLLLVAALVFPLALRHWTRR